MEFETSDTKFCTSIYNMPAVSRLRVISSANYVPEGHKLTEQSEVAVNDGVSVAILDWYLLEECLIWSRIYTKLKKGG